MSRASEAGKRAWEWVQYVDWFYNMEALARAPYMFFPSYVPDALREYNRGEAFRIGHEKYLLQNWGKLDPNIPLSEQSLCKLFRDSGRYPWVREEYCLKGYERLYNGVWYRVIAERVDDATPPPNNAQAWEAV